MYRVFVPEKVSSETAVNLDVELRKVVKIYNGEMAVRSIDLNIFEGEFFSILGPSGCGKTTTLRLIAGFELPSEGQVYIRGEEMSQVPPYLRPVNTVFQSYALFNHLTVFENIAFGLRIKKLNRLEIKQRTQVALQLVKMESFANRYPNQLSGGQQQRVALARALVNRPQVLLLDEPLGALDLKLRKDMQMELSHLHKTLGMTFVMVTHDQEEALSLSDRIAVMRAGYIEQIGSPLDVYERPASPFVADFIGETNLFNGEVDDSDYSGLTIITNSGLKLIVDSQNVNTPPTKNVVVSVRPEKIQLSLYPLTELMNCFEGRLIHVMYMGSHVHCTVQLLSGDRLKIMQPNIPGTWPDSETPIYAQWGTNDAWVMIDETS